MLVLPHQLHDFNYLLTLLSVRVMKVMQEGRTPLWTAMESKNMGLVQMLIDAGADVNTCDSVRYVLLFVPLLIKRIVQYVLCVTREVLV
jgi:hypothetical protein